MRKHLSGIYAYLGGMNHLKLSNDDVKKIRPHVLDNLILVKFGLMKFGGGKPLAFEVLVVTSKLGKRFGSGRSRKRIADLNV